ncbi:MAG: threonine synthase [Candidatus Peregrinibacteria bacterium]|nr:threonine synthase [Candidatus Peregrinibacteria bacterium]
MKLFSTNRKADPKFLPPLATFEKAVMQGLAEDGGLFMPTEIPTLPKDFFEKISILSLPEISFEVAKTLLQEDIPEKDLRKIIDESINFDAPLKQVVENIFSLELFHGPTLAFKDFGARFMARIMSYFINKSDKKITIIVATSGDTGSAVASGVYNVPGIRVFLLYPSGKVSKIQEQQLTTMGGNIHALEIDGTFDDCQRLVKTAFVDKELKTIFAENNDSLGSANSINIARLIPQSFYYFYAYAQLKNKDYAVFSIPSGNLGNLTAGLIAKKMGLPIKKFIAANNSNNSFTEYLHTGNFTAKASVTTISNAMDVGNPSNFVRILELYENNLEKIRQDISSADFSDEKTAAAIKEVYEKYHYTMDPHGAVAYLGLKTFSPCGIFFETAHPAKFLDVVEPIIGTKIQIPERLASCLTKTKVTTKLSKEFQDFKNFLAKNAK